MYWMICPHLQNPMLKPQFSICLYVEKRPLRKEWGPNSIELVSQQKARQQKSLSLLACPGEDTMGRYCLRAKKKRLTSAQPCCYLDLGAQPLELCEHTFLLFKPLSLRITTIFPIILFYVFVTWDGQMIKLMI